MLNLKILKLLLQKISPDEYNRILITEMMHQSNINIPITHTVLMFNYHKRMKIFIIELRKVKIRASNFQLKMIDLQERANRKEQDRKTLLFFGRTSDFLMAWNGQTRITAFLFFQSSNLRNHEKRYKYLKRYEIMMSKQNSSKKSENTENINTTKDAKSVWYHSYQETGTFSYNF